MPIVSIDEVGTVGIVSDVPSHELPPEAWSAGQNVRMFDGHVERFYGHQAVYGTPSIAPYGLMNVLTLTSNFWVYPGLLKVYVSDGAVETNITRQTAGVDVNYAAAASPGWNGGILNGIPILNNGIDDPQEWYNGTVKADPSIKLRALSNWPAATKARVIRVFKQYLVALDVTQAGARDPLLVKWSSAAPIAGVPAYWSSTPAASDSGEYPLAETHDFLIDCLPLGDVNIIYKEKTSYGMQYIGPPQIFRFWKLFGKDDAGGGILTRNCVTEVKKKHLVATQGDLLLHDGQMWESVLTSKFRKKIFESDLDPTYFDRSFLVVNATRNEVWFCYPTGGAAFPNIALVWNWKDNACGFRDIPLAAFAAAGIIDPGVNTSWDADGASWDSDATIWDLREYNPTKKEVMLAVPGVSRLYQANITDQFAGVNYAAYIERTGLGIVGRDQKGQPKVDLGKMKFLKGVAPRIRAQQGTLINIYLAKQMSLNGAVTWKGPYEFDPNAGKTWVSLDPDGGVSTLLVGIRFSSTGGGWWEIDGYDLDISLLGSR